MTLRYTLVGFNALNLKPCFPLSPLQLSKFILEKFVANEEVVDFINADGLVGDSIIGLL